MSSPWVIYGNGEVHSYQFERDCPGVLADLGDVLTAWEGTPYAEGSQVRGVGADCVRALCGVADEMLGVKHDPDHLPADAAMTSPTSARSGMRKILRAFGATEVFSGILKPLDFIVTRPPGVSTGPGHAMIVGPSRSIWHMDMTRGFCRVGNSLEGNKLVGIYRIGDLWEQQ